MLCCFLCQASVGSCLYFWDLSQENDSLFLNCKCCLKFIDIGNSSIFQWAMIMKSLVNCLKMIPTLKDDWFLILILNFKSNPGPLCNRDAVNGDLNNKSYPRELSLLSSLCFSWERLYVQYITFDQGFLFFLTFCDIAVGKSELFLKCLHSLSLQLFFPSLCL